MTISAYQVDNVIKAYNKQSRPRLQLNAQPASSERFADSVSLSSEDAQAAAYQKISYTLADILRNKKE